MSAFLDERLGEVQDPAEERAFFDMLARTDTHPTGASLAEEVMRDLISVGQVPMVSPILKALRTRDNSLCVDTTDQFNKTFLEYMKCESDDIHTSLVAYLGGCTVRLEEIVAADEFTSDEFCRLNPVPLPALRVVFDPIDI